ncbi:MAG TPA: ATP-binding cassette domain-containing protein, partial [Candidatus Pullilachnospira stercoravium]|nr:ATP-binding cassette domain-containing protein [Candidatus Pullilachnospira stercoravium]
MSLQVHIRKKLGDFVLEADFEQEEGCMGILGASGCGKSMTLKCIAGIETPDSGRICLDGQVLFDSEKKINQKPQKRQVGFLFQNYALFPTMTVEENIGCGVRDRSLRKQIVREQIQRFQLQGLEKLRPSQLSGGQQQRTALARMLAGRPGIILLDEPFSALDSFLRDQMHRELMEILREFSGKTLLVSHSREEIYKFCDTVTVMEQGRTLMTRGTRELFASPGLVSAARLTGLKNISPYRKIGHRQVLAMDWNVKLQLPPEDPRKTDGREDGGTGLTDAAAGELPEQGFIGIRGHHILAASDTAASDGRSKGEEPAVERKDAGGRPGGISTDGRDAGEGTEAWNLYRPVLEDMQEAPFEDIFLLRNAQGGDEKPLWW